MSWLAVAVGKNSQLPVFMHALGLQQLQENVPPGTTFCILYIKDIKQAFMFMHLLQA